LLPPVTRSEQPRPHPTSSKCLLSAERAARLTGVADRSRSKRGGGCRRKSAAAHAIESATAGRRRARIALRNQRSSRAALPAEPAGDRREWIRTLGPPSTASSAHSGRARRDPRAIVKPWNADRSRRQAIGAVEAHCPGHLGAACVVPEYPKIADPVTRGGGAALPASGIEGAYLFPLPRTGCCRQRRAHPVQIKLMRPATAVVIHVGQ
jgi:hypothetical protein